MLQSARQGGSGTLDVSHDTGPCSQRKGKARATSPSGASVTAASTSAGRVDRWRTCADGLNKTGAVASASCAGLKGPAPPDAVPPDSAAV